MRSVALMKDADLNIELIPGCGARGRLCLIHRVRRPGDVLSMVIERRCDNHGRNHRIWKAFKKRGKKGLRLS